MTKLMIPSKKRILLDEKVIINIYNLHKIELFKFIIKQ